MSLCLFILLGGTCANDFYCIVNARARLAATRGVGLLVCFFGFVWSRSLFVVQGLEDVRDLHDHLVAVARVCFYLCVF